MFKERILAITKSDILDQELETAIAEELEVDCDFLFISSVSGKGIQELKDKLWLTMNNQ